MRKISLSIIAVILLTTAFILPACSSEEETVSTPDTRTIDYYDTESITVPYEVTKVASGWNAQNSIITMLGYGNKLVATTDIIKASPIFGKFVPSITDAVVCFTSSGELNIESVLQTDPDVAFIMSGGADRFQPLADMGIPVAVLKDSSLKNLTDRTVISGEILGEDAYEKALEYIDYYNDNVKRVQERLDKIPEGEKVKVYLSSGRVLSTSGRPSLNQDWMDMAGVINIADSWDVPMVRGGDNANLEEIIAANPDVIICMKRSDAEIILSDPAWSVIKAVKDGRVYTNPKGMFWLCRETTEEAMQFLWLAKTVYPEYFTDINMEEETRYFYKTFYGYDLTDEDVQLFLNPE